jgi:hypothetical protein
MTYDEVCIEIVSLGGTEIGSNLSDSRAFAMSSPCLHLVALPDASGAGVLAEAWALSDDGERGYVTTFYAIGREQVATMLPMLTTQAQNITGEAP